ncbi:pentatricopeptide repeat-containing protein At1g53600, mitochondrial [Telopea speciosissima]|uniref:pentatricopeptide repeat-containing protein At1g53600, mitochondrial n=1 Tax=Telopea speciosissima TaxID=54955 RepID=UPI001CC7CA53|nr:pentatricopeptide repeat-containing protein At1g53600, mitochondrial [Telopea speciosissima]
MLAIRTSILLSEHQFRLDLLVFISAYSTYSTTFLSKPQPSSAINSKSSSKFIVLCNCQISKNGRNGNLKAAESIFNRMPFKNVISWTAMLTACADNGKINKARKLFDEMPQRNTASWNAMITAYIRNNQQVDIAYELFCRMPERNPVSYAAMITGFVRAGMILEAEKLYLEMPLTGRDPVASNALISGYLKVGKLEEAVQIFEGMSERNVVTWSSMVDGYCKDGRISDGKELFEKMPERNVVSWTSMIGGYMKMRQFGDGFGLFLRMRKEDDVKVNSTTLTIVFEACADLSRFSEGIQVHGLVFSMGFDFDVFLGNSIITMYCRVGYMDAAKTMFDLMNNKDIVSWNSLIAGYVENDKTEEAYMLFETMPIRDVVSWTTMISGFSNKGMIGEFIDLFIEMPEKDDISWTAVISGLVSNGEYEEALRWFIEMVQCSVKPNSLTLSSVLCASAGLAILNQGLQIHTHVVKMDMEFEVSVQNALISMYAKCGSVGDAYRIYIGIHKPNLISVNSMITGFAQNGFGKEALEVFEQMEAKGFEPNQITFLGILSACVHVGLVGEGQAYFKSMSSSYNIEPGPDHYTCMVDLLGRAGLLKEAIDLIHSMPFKPHSAVWSALLSACRTHLDLDLAKLAAQQLFELEPNSATAYVVLSDIYSLAGHKEDGEEIRMAKKLRGVKKSPGCSWIIVDKKVHLFLAGDDSRD